MLNACPIYQNHHRWIASMIGVWIWFISTCLNPAWADVVPAQLESNSSTSITFSVQDQRLSLVLDADPAQSSDTPLHLQGTVLGDPRSWVALTVYEWPNDVTGQVYTNGQGWQIETAASAERLLGEAPSSDSALVAISPELNLLALRHRGSLDKVLGTANSVRASINKNTSIARVTTRALRVGIVIDSRFNDHHGGRGVARAMSIMNGVDAILQQQLGLALEVVAVVDHTDPSTDPYKDLSPNITNAVMPVFQQLRLSDPLLSDDLSMVHLFTGHFHSGSDTVFGLSWVYSLCATDGTDVSISTPFLFDTLLAAHEIGHNLGAVHDDSELCQTPNPPSNQFLMWPRITSATTENLSSCSVTAMSAGVDAQCNVDVLDIGIRASAVSSDDQLNHELSLEVTNNDITRASQNIMSETLLPTGHLGNPL